MPSLIDFRRRIRSVKNTQQITKAMKMVSAAKLRRAQERVLAARPYSRTLRELLANVAGAVDPEVAASNPLMAVREEKKVLVIVVTADRGLAGAFNSNLIKRAVSTVTELSSKGAEVSFELVGRKGRDFFKRRYTSVAGEMVGIFLKSPTIEHATELAKRVMQRYADAEVDAVYLAVNEFKSVMAPNISVSKILPVEVPQGSAAGGGYIYEQPPDQLLNALLPRYVNTQIYQSLLESMAAEHAARMTAMDSASSNASDVIDALTLHMNRVRQATITKEIIEIVSGASALE